MPNRRASSGTLIPAAYRSRISALRSRLRFDTGAWGSEKPRYICCRTRLVACSIVYKVVPHRGLHTQGFHSIDAALDYGIRVVYWGGLVPDSPVSDGPVQLVARNSLIRNLHAVGVAVSDLARQHQISPQRVHQILRNN